MDADIDWRIPVRIGAVGVALVIAWAVVANGQRFSGRTASERSRAIIILYGLFGATIALLLTIRQDSYCFPRARAPGAHPCSYRSFLGWNAEPILVEVLFALIGAAVGAAVGLLIVRWARGDQSGSARLVGASSDQT